MINPAASKIGKSTYQVEVGESAIEAAAKADQHLVNGSFNRRRVSLAIHNVLVPLS